MIMIRKLMLMPVTDSPVIRRSLHVPLRNAALSPSAMPSRLPIMKPGSISASDTGRVRLRMLLTCSPDELEAPSSSVNSSAR